MRVDGWRGQWAREEVVVWARQVDRCGKVWGTKTRRWGERKRERWRWRDAISQTYSLPTCANNHMPTPTPTANSSRDTTLKTLIYPSLLESLTYPSDHSSTHPSTRTSPVHLSTFIHRVSTPGAAKTQWRDVRAPGEVSATVGRVTSHCGTIAAKPHPIPNSYS